MNICMILTNRFDPDVRVYKEATFLTRASAQVDILCWDRSRNTKHPEMEILEGIRIVRFGCLSQPGTGLKQLPAFFAFIRKVRRYLRTANYDAYHLHDMDGGITGMFALPKDARYVLDMHEYYEVGSPLKRRLIQRLVLRLIRKSMAALYENDIYLSPPYGQYESKLYSLKNYPDRGLIQRKEKTESDSFRIGYHGAVRGQIRQFSALFEAVKEMPDVRVDINGGGIDLPALRQMAAGLANVHVHGPYNGVTESTALYQQTDVLFCGYDKHVPNHQKDAEAVKFFEAIITATPMIMQSGIGMGDKVTSRGYGLVVETDNAGEIKNAILRLKTDPVLYRRCRENEINDADRYYWQNEVTVLGKIYGL